MNIRTIYYKRVKTFLPYPFNQEIDTDLVHFSKTKKDFEKNVFLKVRPNFTPHERIGAIAAHLQIKHNLIKLEKA